MGTRNLTIVYLDGEYKVAQYGQWDGYPEGQGRVCLNFLKEKMDKEKFVKALRSLDWISEKELDDLWKSYGADENGLINMEDADKFNYEHPEFSRNTGAEILSLIQEGNINRLDNDIEFAANSLFCEWAWLVDLDSGKFEAYRGFNKRPLTEKDRFFYLGNNVDNYGYYGIIKVAEWNLNNLPSEDDFLEKFKEEEE